MYVRHGQNYVGRRHSRQGPEYNHRWRRIPMHVRYVMDGYMTTIWCHGTTAVDDYHGEMGSGDVLDRMGFPE